MVFAKTSKAASRLSEQVRNHNFKKVYLAVVHGKIKKDSGRLEHFLLKNAQTNTVKVVARSIPGAKEAILDYETLESTSEFSLVRIRLHTGRSHQIRVQLSAIGHPLYGDKNTVQH
jgi:23S rRNA pseudouridine1911/1915/1917 synthase